MDTKDDSGTPKRRRARKSNDTPVSAPADVATVLRIGGTAALVCAAASSAVSLFWLAILVGWPVALAWLLPASLDVYAGTSLYVGYRLPVAHPAALPARRNARFALALTVACNGIYHALVLFGSAWPYWVHDSLLVLVSALPPVVVERLLHLRSKIGHEAQAAPGSGTSALQVPAAPARAGGTTRKAALAQGGTTPGTEAEDERPTAAATPAPDPAVAAGPQDGAAEGGAAAGGTNVVAINGAGRRPMTEWAEIALPYYRRHVDGHGAAPTANDLVRMIRDARPDLTVPKSDRAARNIRQATETLAEQAPAKVESEPDREREAG